MKVDRKILLAVDGSEQSLTAVRYLGNIVSKTAQVVVFHVQAEVPEAFRDMDVDPFAKKKEYPLGIWKVHQRELVDFFIEKARGILAEAGFSGKRVQVKIEPLRSGIARDIYNESHQDYGALVLGRVGNNRLDDIMMGSVSAKLVDVTHHIPVIVVGGNPQKQKILVGFDGSRGSTRAVSCIGDLVEPAICEVVLCHVIRPLNFKVLGSNEVSVQTHETRWIEKNKRQMVTALEAARGRLVAAGLAPERIRSEILTGETSRAAALAGAARANGCESMVFGRRGVTSVETFVSGRVSRKLLHLAYDMALWMVS